jgi:transcriptional regulator with XRE-family HTH domain
MDERQLGSLIRAVRVRKGLRQRDLAEIARVSTPTISRLEQGRAGGMTLETIARVAAAVDVRVDLLGRWRGGDGERLLNRRHSLLADSFAAFLGRHDGWLVEPEVSFSIYGERGFIDQLCWHAATGHLLVVELKTEFADINEMLGTLDRKARLARRIAAERGWRPTRVSVWLIVADSRTNRRHAAEHASLLRSRFPLDGRSLASFLHDPTATTFGMAFWTDLHRANAGRQASPTMTRVRRQRQPSAAEGSFSGTRAGPNPGFPRRVAASSVNTVRPDRAQRSPGECLT